MKRRSLARTTLTTQLTLARATRLASTLATVSALSALLAVGCGSAPDEDSEPTLASCGGGAEQPCEASTPVCGFAGRAFATAHGAGLFSDLGSGARDLPAPVGANPMGVYHVSTTDDFCVPVAASDPVSLAQKTLIQAYGCSSPYYFEAFNSQVTTPATNPTNASSCALGVDPWACWPDKANGYPQLCPISSALVAYVKSLGSLRNASGQLSDVVAHFSGDRDLSFDPARVVPSPQLGATPSAPAGYAWVIPWEDPHGCGLGGCMCDI